MKKLLRYHESYVLLAAVALASGNKCARCWRVLPEVKAEGEICNRCADAVAKVSAAPGSS